jgi:hypothetical protein
MPCRRISRSADIPKNVIRFLTEREPEPTFAQAMTKVNP